MVARSRNDTLRLVAAGALALVLLAGVTLAAAAPRINLRASDAVGAVLVALLFAGLVLTIAMVLQGRLLRSPYFWLAVIIGLVMAALLLRVGGAAPPPRLGEAAVPTATPTPNSEAAGASGIASTLLGLFALVILLIAAVRAYIWWRDTQEPAPSDAPAMSESALDDAIDAALVDLRSGGDHRRAVIAAYAAAEASLAAHGARRLRSESPLEYLDRVIRLMGAKGAAVDRLTALYEQARYSDHTIDAAMRDEAIEAFEGLRTQLEDAP